MLDAMGFALAAAGLMVTGITVYGVLRLPDLYRQPHAAGMATGFGVIAVPLASIATRNAAIITHAALVGTFLALTTPVASQRSRAASRPSGHEHAPSRSRTGGMAISAAQREDPASGYDDT